MNLKILVQNAKEPTDEGIRDLCQFFESEATKIDLPVSVLDNIIIYDELNVDRAYDYVGAPTPGGQPEGQTVSKQFGDQVKCSILFPLETFYAIDILRNNRQATHPPEELQRYVLYHELGRCRDDITRKDLRSVKV